MISSYSRLISVPRNVGKVPDALTALAAADHALPLRPNLILTYLSHIRCQLPFFIRTQEGFLP